MPTTVGFAQRATPHQASHEFNSLPWPTKRSWVVIQLFLDIQVSEFSDEFFLHVALEHDGDLGLRSCTFH